MYNYVCATPCTTHAANSTGTPNTPEVNIGKYDNDICGIDMVLKNVATRSFKFRTVSAERIVSGRGFHRFATQFEENEFLIGV